MEKKSNAKVRGCLSWLLEEKTGKKNFKNKPGRGAAVKGLRRREKSDDGCVAAGSGEGRKKLGSLVLPPLKLQNRPPPYCKCWKPVFIGKKYCQVFKIGPLTFFFCKI